jgi:hypothetical protein
MSTLRLTTISNQTGSASVPSDTVINGSAKAWVNFNGTGTVAIRASFNVSSITDNGTGDYTVNFTTAMPDADYAVDGLIAASNTGFGSLTIKYNTTQTASTVTVRPVNNTTYYDSVFVNVAIFR